MTKRDIWSDWLLNRRFGGDANQLKAMLDRLGPVRDKLLLHANVGEGSTLLDVGCGDGFIGFGALQNVLCNVVFATFPKSFWITHA